MSVRCIQVRQGTPSARGGCPFRVVVLLAVLFTGLLPGCSDDPGAGRRSDRAREPLLADSAKRPDWMAPPPEPPPSREAMQAAEVERPLLIGVIGPESGDSAFFGLQVLAGVTQAAQDFNAAGGIGGRPIEVVHLDNQDDPVTTDNMVEQLIQRQALAIIAAPTGWSTFGPTRLANSSHTLFMAVGSRRHIARSGPYVFRFALPDETATEELIGQAVRRFDLKRFALVVSSIHDHALTNGSAFRQAVAKLGGEVVLEADIYDTFSGKANIDAVVQTLKSGSPPPQAVFFAGGAEQGALLAVAMRRAGLGQPLVGSEDLFEDTFLETGGSAVVGTLLFSSYDPAAPVGPGRESLLASRFSALAYDAFTIIAKAVGTSGVSKPSKVRESLLATKDFIGITGPAAFTAEGVPIKRPFVFRVEEQQGRVTFSRLQESDG